MDLGCPYKAVGHQPTKTVRKLFCRDRDCKESIDLLILYVVRNALFTVIMHFLFFVWIVFINNEPRDRMNLLISSSNLCHISGCVSSMPWVTFEFHFGKKCHSTTRPTAPSPGYRQTDYASAFPPPFYGQTDYTCSFYTKTYCHTPC